MVEDSSAEQHVLDAIRAITASWARGLSLDQIRAGFETFLQEAGHSRPADVTTTDQTIGPLPARWFIPRSLRSDSPLLYCHGGGYQIGSLDSHASLMGRLAEATGLRVLGFEYRLAPEHRYPAAIEDAWSAYQWLLDRGQVPLAVVGDSAGGALALHIALRARDQGLPLPKALVMLSAWLDLSLSGASYQELATVDEFSKPGQLRAMARTFLGRGYTEAGGDPGDPSVSPLFARLDGLPPLLLHAGGHDITLDDSRQLAERAKAANVPVSLHVFERMVHHFQVFSDLPQSTRSLHEIAVFLHGMKG